jgi:serine/arginine repetitive matrix protein 2
MSSLDMHSRSSHRPERTRTESHPSRPESATSHHSLDHHRRKHSFNSGRSSSPTSSVQSRDSEKDLELEVQREIRHVRERNWNAPRPKWSSNAQHHRGLSVSPSSSTSMSHIHSHPHGLHTNSPRVESPTHRLLAGKPTLRLSSSHSSLITKDQAPLVPSPVSLSAKGKGKQQAAIHHHTSRSSSPIDHTDPHMKDDGNALKGPASSTRFGWQFPRNKNPLPPLQFDEHSLDGLVSPAHPRTLSSPLPTPGSRPTSRASASVMPSHIPVRSPHVSERNVGSSSGLKKGHKRSTTELSEPAGGVRSRFTSEPIPLAKDNNHEDSVLGMFGYLARDRILILFSAASDEELPSPLHISTPTMRPVQLPDDHISSPGSPPKVLARSSTFDRSSPSPWPQPPPEPSLALTTPPRPQFSSSPKVEFKTPSPPRGLPELPGPPSSEEEKDEEKDWMLTGRPHLDISSMKTPKPPGAWASTPLPTRHDPLVRTHTYPDSDGFGESISEAGLATPVASLSRSSSLPAQTPLPPGAWLLTPAIDRRRSVLKVRFDVESEHSASDAPVNGHAHSEDVNGFQIESQSVSSFDVSTPKGQSSCLPPPVEAKEEEVATPVTPRSTPPPSLRKSPSIRVVDAFGREQMSDDIVQNSTVTSPTPVSSTPRGRSSVRIVDAMGREVEEVFETISNEGKSEGDIILGHNEALRRVRTSIADLASGLSEVDRSVTDLLGLCNVISDVDLFRLSSSNELEFHEKRLNELNNISLTARDARHKLSQTLRMTRSAEDNLRSKYGSLRASMRKSKLLVSQRQTFNESVAFFSCHLL